MNKTVLWILAAAFVIAACVLYAVHASRKQLDVAPDAQREIEKAKRR